jgi:methyl-accepting chemotaxis protein
MTSVTAALAEISSFAKDIDYMGSEIKLIALNAIIKAAQAGRDGAAFSVIAESVKRQSVEVCDQAVAIVGSIGTITRHIDALHLHGKGSEVGLEASGEAGGLHQVRLVETISLLKEFTGSAHLLLEQTDQTAAAMISGIEAALSALDSRAICDSLEQNAIVELERLVLSLRSSMPRTAGVGSGTLDTQAERYTMGSERKIHQLFASSLAARNSLDPAVNPAAVSAFRSGDVDFGVNVELF